MANFWFCAMAFMAVMYVILDGLDWGAGILHLWVGRSDSERRQVLQTVGPVWDGNEVWLLALGGVMFLAFPTLLATALSGLYLPILIVVWLLIGRALSIELRHQVQDPLWTQFWDVLFFATSLLLAIFFGAALGNLIRGVSIDASGTFFAPLWTTFTIEEPVGILDWYTVLIGVHAAAAVAHHGAAWLFLRTDGKVQERARGAALHLWPWLLVLTVVSTAASFWVQPNLTANIVKYPAGLIFGVLFIAGIALSRNGVVHNKAGQAFLGSSLYVTGLLGCAALGSFPYLLMARQPEFSMSIQSLAVSPESLRTGLYWWVPGILLALTYTFLIYKRFTRPVTIASVESETH